jgi:lipopolysaccharide transport system ATP-binding protein
MIQDIAIRVQNLSKCYQIYDRPSDRLKQFIVPKIKNIFSKKNQIPYYHEFWALQGVSFELKRGQTMGIIGRNGSGKSTLLQLICGTLTPTTGEVQTKGRIAALLELGSGFNPEFTGRENIYLNATVLGLTKSEIDDRFIKILEFADIGEFIEQPIKTYSSGMMLRLAFAVIAHVDADILIVDEALAVGDAFFTQKCMRFLRNFMKNGTILFVSHDTASVKNLCNSALWLNKGHQKAIGTPKNVCELYLEDFYEDISIPSADRVNKDEALILKKTSTVNIYKDQRQKYFNNSNLRNDLQIFEFNSDAASFGKGGAKIVNVNLLSQESETLSWVVGGEQVTLRVTVNAKIPLDSPIVGFFVKDRLGQVLFGDNTFLSFEQHKVTCDENGELITDFIFDMPILPKGEYSIAVAIANGSQAEHEQHHWIHDALFFQSESSNVSTGLIGIPMINIKLQTNLPIA